MLEKKEKKELYTQIGRRVREARETAGYTQEKLASTIDVSVQYISDLERGIVGLSVQTLIKLCSTLHTSSDYILMGKTSELSYLQRLVQDIPEEEIPFVDKGLATILEALHYTPAG